MADAVTSQTLLDADRNVVMKFTNLSDGTGESAVTKVDPALLNAFSGGGTPTEVSIDFIIASTFGMAVNILWDATSDVTAWICGQSESGKIYDFRPFGGIRNNAGSGKTGKIQFTTVGHSANDSYSIILGMRKA